MSKSKIRMQRNRLKLMFAASSIVLMRRIVFLTTLLSLPVVLLSAGSPLLAASKHDEIHFSDVEGHWAETPIIEAVISGIASGYEDGTFKPDRVVSRREFTVMLASTLQIPLVIASSKNDQGTDDPYLQSLQDAGILHEGDFPVEEIDKGLQRSEMMKLVVNALEPEAAFGQPEEIKKKAQAAGLLEDDQVGQASSSLEATATRAEAIIMLQRLQNLLGLG
ncbi:MULTISPECIES: S-layer homology domain-containing protein [unclassified Paenibacillus]|uniref:S-layer homology domain-containing protein n=1 Tax=unclassified Paenibacillus TaxID=185978 RepID=UPI0036283956